MDPCTLMHPHFILDGMLKFKTSNLRNSWTKERNCPTPVHRSEHSGSQASSLGSQKGFCAEHPAARPAKCSTVVTWGHISAVMVGFSTVLLAVTAAHPCWEMQFQALHKTLIFVSGHTEGQWDTRGCSWGLGQTQAMAASSPQLCASLTSPTSMPFHYCRDEQNQSLWCSMYL